MPDFVKECNKAGIKPIGGIEFRDIHHVLLYIGIAINNEGFRELNDFLTWHNLNKTPLPPCPPVFQNVLVVYPFGNKLPRRLKTNEFIGVRPHELRKLITSPFGKLKTKLLALHPVSFASKENYQLHNYLRAIDNNTLLSKLTENDLARPDEYFLPPDFFKIA
jgi:DNA polymerase III alpha subunit